MVRRSAMAEDWLVDVRKYAPDADEGVVGAIVRYCGIALQSRDGQLVAMSDKKERELVRENYLKKKLGLVRDDAELDEAVIAVGQVMKEDRTKNRVTVYYLLAQHFGLLNMFGGVVGTAGAAGVAAAAMGTMNGNSDDDATVAPLAAAGLAGAGLSGAGMAAAVAPVASVVEPVSTYTAPPPPAEPVAAYSTYDNDVDTGGGGGLGWLKWLLLAAVLLALIFFGMRYCSNQAVQPAADAGTAARAGETADAANTVATPPVEPAATSTAAPVAAVPQGSGVTAGERGGRPMLTVYFDTGKSAVSDDLAAASSKLKEYMTKNPDAKIAVSGFNDPTGNAAANAELSKNRAKAVAKAIADTGIPAASIALEKPAETTGTGTSDAESRRVEVVVKP
jgi:outer membrane protein OmpA-like peptidoglycan-associated protein